MPRSANPNVTKKKTITTKQKRKENKEGKNERQ
jgi:hypothetical protein